MNRFFTITWLILSLASCKKDDNLSVVLPGDYLPAYPGSEWFYSNGERSSVYQSYRVHSYEYEVSSPKRTPEKLVPYIDGQYLYKYEITQNSTRYPLKKLIDETATKMWEVNMENDKIIFRQVYEHMDTLSIKVPDNGSLVDTVFADVLVIAEFLEGNGLKGWHTKEYYAKNVGLVQVDVNNPYDTLPAIVKKQLLNYKIQK